MQFTPQQLAGGPKFSSVTRIGNWQEEIALEESKVDNFRQKSQTGNLSLRRLESKIATCTQLVPLTFASDHAVRFGDFVILQHDSSRSVLACDPFEQVDIGPETYLVTTVLEEPVPKARNTFRITRPPRHLQDVLDNKDDDILRVGQPFLLACHDTLLVQPGARLLAPTLYLASVKKNERTATKRTNRQMVFMTTELNGDCIWSATIPSKGKTNGTERFLQVGQPVNNETSYQLTHRQTNMYLTCDSGMRTNTEFGLELECFADRSAAYGKIALMVSEFKGTSTANTLTKPDSALFAWHFLLSASSEEEQLLQQQSQTPRSARSQKLNSRSSRLANLPPAATLQSILSQFRSRMQDKGIDAYWNLRTHLMSLEKQLTVATGKLDRIDLRNALLQWDEADKMGLQARHFDAVLDEVDRQRLGLIDIQELMSVLRGDLSPQRLEVLDDVFLQLVREVGDGKGSVGVAALQTRFNAQDHPLVALGGYSDSYAFNHILSCLEVPATRKAPASINRAMFRDYYADLSATVEDDEYFTHVVRSNWSC